MEPQNFTRIRKVVETRQKIIFRFLKYLWMLPRRRLPASFRRLRRLEKRHSGLIQCIHFWALILILTFCYVRRKVKNGCLMESQIGSDLNWENPFSKNGYGVRGVSIRSPILGEDWLGALYEKNGGGIFVTNRTHLLGGAGQGDGGIIFCRGQPPSHHAQGWNIPFGQPLTPTNLAWWGTTCHRR